MKLRYALIIAMLFALNLAAQQPMNHNSVVEINENEVKFKDNKILLNLHEEYSYFDLSTGSVSNSPIAEIQALNDEFGVTSIKKLFPFVKKINNQPHDLTTIYEIEYESGISPLELAQRYSEITEVEFAEPDYIASILLVPNDPYYDDGSQWYHDDVKAEDAWDLSTGDATQIIGIIDTGVDWEHEDLSDNIWINQAELDGDEGVDDDNNGFVDDIRGWDFYNDDNNPMDDNSHGTHVAGIAGAKTNNNLGIAGIAWNAKLMPVKVLQSSGRGSWSDIAQGAAYAAENGSTVLNMSLGGYSESLTLKTALENAYHYSVIIAAAGNDRFCIHPEEGCLGRPMYPACYGWVLGVQASNKFGSRVGWSNYDPSGPIEFWNSSGYNYEVLAPGSEIYSTIPGNRYRYLSGTSMATPVTSGAVALLKSYHPNISNEQIFSRIIMASGGGVLDIEEAMNLTLVPDVRLLSFEIIDTLDGCDNDGKTDAGETFEMSIKVKNYGGWPKMLKQKLAWNLKIQQ
jgi:subtilisin family serine protease